MSETIKYTSENGYTGILYGKSSLMIFDKDGKKLNLKKTYHVASNSYSVAVSPVQRKDMGTSIGLTTSEVIMKYLEQQQRVSYQGRRCLNIH